MAFMSSMLLKDTYGQVLFIDIYEQVLLKDIYGHLSVTKSMDKCY